MGRRLRPNLSDAVFHLTARIHGGERLLAGLQAPTAGVVRGEAHRSGVSVVAYAVMSNHFHIVLIQGSKPLAEYMQPVMRRVAMIVHAVHRRGGVVFERRYHDRFCSDASYFRTAIAYAHLNAVRAGICTDPASYPWSSHRAFCTPAATDAPTRQEVVIERALRAFAPTSDASLAVCRAQYLRFLEWRLARDRRAATNPEAEHAVLPAPPDCSGGDVLWARGAVAGAVTVYNRPLPTTRPAEDLQTVVGRTLAEVAPHLSREVLRSGARTRPLVGVRRQVIANCLASGFTPRQIGRYLRVSASAVSRVAVAMRLPVGG